MLVFSSGGPVAWAAASLSPRARRSPAAARLNPVCVNSGVTRSSPAVAATTLVTFNGHAHLDGVPDVLTYR